MQLTGAEILVEELVKHGVETVFGYPGGAVLNIYDELYKNSHRINHVITAHEQGASHAADGYARVTGKTGVVIATSGPGATNIVTGVANAYLDSIPMVAITGNVAVPLLGRDSFQEVDIVGITQPIVKHSFVVRDVKNLEKTLKEAFLIASSGRKGPVLVDIPKSVQIESCEYGGVTVEFEPKPVLQENNFAQALQAIKESKKPYIYCGGGVISGNAEKEILELSKIISAPVGLSMMGLSAVPASYELNLGMCGMHGKYSSSLAQSEADLMIAVGVRFSDRATGNVKEYTKKCTVIHIDIDAAEFGKNINSEIELCGDVKEILNTLLSSLSEVKNEEWLNQINEYKKKDEEPASKDFTPKNIIETVNKYCAPDTVVATDVGQHQMWTMQYYKFENSRTLLTSGGLGTMGFGLGAAIGGCIANNKKRTILFTGDGSFGMNLNEVATAVSQNLPVVIVILNNGVLGMVRQWQKMFYGERFSQTTLQRKTDFPLLARAFGAQGFSVKELAELEDIMKNKLPEHGPVIIDCHIDMDEKVLPMIPPGGSIKNIVMK
ncbi:acetolactate synthase-1/2/3 large subunit [Elusimicrobium posterum]|uniref:biosynthetic-type acetolactate synthase large subunit n=1 Tax=Elusimicrobium posterum TaxID=3116653 RepID=UPI003C792E8A